MKKYLGLIFLLFSLTSFAQQPVKHVILITIDGFRPDFYLDSSWSAPHLKELLKEGFHANGVNSVFPSMTYPSHTTIVTGVWPLRHGVYYNNRFDPKGISDENYWMDSSIHMPTIWRAVHDRGQKVASIYWPVSADAPVDYNIPDIGGRGETVLEAHIKPVGFMQELEKNLFNGTSHGGDQNEARIAAYIIKKDQPTLLTLHLFSVDHAEHVQGRTGDMVKKAVSDADEAVGIVEDALKTSGIWDNTVFIVTGDHGFLTLTKTLNPNAWLKKAGLMNDIQHDDWKAQFNYSGGSAYLYLKDRNDNQTLKAVNSILNSLPDSMRRYFRIIDRKQMNKVGGNPEVAFALSGMNGAAFGGKDDVALKDGKGGTHGYYPDFFEIRTGFIAVGPGIKKGGMTQVMNLRDIAPIVAKVLNLNFPTADGKIPGGMFESTGK